MFVSSSVNEIQHELATVPTISVFPDTHYDIPVTHTNSIRLITGVTPTECPNPNI